MGSSGEPGRCEHGKLYAEFCWDCVDRSAAMGSSDSGGTTYRQKTLRMPGTPRPIRRSAMMPNETAFIMTSFGGELSEREHVIRRIRAHKPNRFAEQVRAYQREVGEELMTDEEFEEQDGIRDLMGYINYQGQVVRVVTGGYGDVEVWRIDDTHEWDEKGGGDGQQR